MKIYYFNFFNLFKMIEEGIYLQKINHILRKTKAISNQKINIYSFMFKRVIFCKSIFKSINGYELLFNFISISLPY